MSLLDKISIFIVTGGYSGYAPKMPGTMGTVAAVILLYALALFMPTVAPFLAAALLLASIAIGTPMLQNLMGKNILSNDKDPQEVVIDEFAGVYLTILPFSVDLKTCIVAFILFRIFDISKPPPIKKLEALPGAIGVMADDLGAAVPAGLLLYLLNEYLL